MMSDSLALFRWFTSYRTDMDITRYSIIVPDADGYPGYEHFESDDGEWVSYRDFEEFVGKLARLSDAD